jgi:type I restriction enzyme, S subunit
MTNRFQILPLEGLVNFKTGKLNSNASKPDGIFPFFTCSQETFLTDTYSFNGEYVLLGGNNAAGVFPLKYFNGKFDAYQRTYVINALDTGVIINRYIYYALRLQLELMKSIAVGVATKFLTLPLLNQTLIPVPPVHTQRKIAAILSAYDNLIENNLRRIKILEEMAQNLYREWFVKFRFPGHEKVRFVDSPLGMIPEIWEVTTVEKTFIILGGGTPSKVVPEYWNEGTVNWYTPTDLTASSSMFMEESSKKISELGLRMSSARLFPSFSVMMTSRATLGVISINTTEACTNQGFITCIPNERFPLYTLFFWLKENVEYFISLGTGATFKEITKGIFKTIELIVPEQLIISQFEEVIQPFTLQILNLQRKNKFLRRTRDMLLPKLISCEVDVSELDIAIPEEAVA